MGCPAAKAAYTAGLKIRKTLAESDAGNRDKQRALSVSYKKFAILAEKEGDGEAARDYYRRCLGMFEEITASAEHVSSEDAEELETLREKAGLE